MTATLRVLNNGLKVVFAPCEAQSIAFGLFVRAGSRHEPRNLAGISHFIEHMLFKGTPRFSPLAITRAIEGRGGNFNAWTSEETTAFYAHLPREYMAEAIDIILEMYLNAAIPSEEFERERNVILEEIKMYEDEPDSVAMENLQRALFKGDALGRPVAGSAATLSRMSAKTLRDYLNAHYLAENTIAVLVGDFNPDEAARLLAKPALRHGRAPMARHGAERVEREVVKPMSVKQTQLALGWRTFGIHDSRKYSATVFDALMGRGMSSRLFQEVREKRGLSYDISSRMQFFDDAGMWTITAGLDYAKRDEAIKIVARELKRIREKPVAKAELERTKEFLIGNFRLSFEKTLSKLFYYGQTALAFGHLVDPEEQIRAISSTLPSDVTAIARAILSERRCATSWVVPASKRG